MEWFKEAFGEHYLTVYAHRNEALAVSEVDFLIAAMQISRDDLILDLACGAGRHSLAFKKLGFKIVGGDLSLELLGAANRKASSLPIFCCDMRRLPVRSASFNAILSLFTSFGYFSDHENLQVLSEVGRCLATSGKFFLDYLNPKLAIDRLNNVAHRDSKRQIGEINVSEKRRYDPTTQRLLKEVTIDKNGSIKCYTESLRLYALEDLALMLKASGLRISRIYGDYLGTSYTFESERLMIVAEKE